ncbi:MFS transporter [Robbsia andropogonis]|uniref:MFS transporter n=1 Tax=Robbsia andropogonis TaxID=28092 RepID=A0A0F5JVW3_9BURK|nr:MFS transporter [Robbsia andropogonis]KKB61810.1 MFS transporter [Robbsia andropogonis]MCP1121075.1 MFS transporter [Robbsia andropogonis]MCP1130868.1 MFS transporter [Robbsia andropogonis]
MNKRLASLAAIPSFMPLAGAVLLLGIAMSFTAPYLSLFSIERAGMTPLQLGIFMTVNAASGVVASTIASRWSDRRGGHRALLIGALLAAALGYVFLCFMTNYIGLLVIGVAFLGTGGSAIALVFSFSRVGLPFRSDAERAFTTASLRTVLSMAWVFGPSVGALILAATNFYGLFLFAAASFAGCAAIVYRMRPVSVSISKGASQGFQATRAAMPAAADRPDHAAMIRPGAAAIDMPSRSGATGENPMDATSVFAAGKVDDIGGTLEAPATAVAGRVDKAALWRAIVALTLLGLVANATIIVLPLYIVQGMHGTRIDVSVMLGLGALLEIPMMLALGARSDRLNKLKWLAACAAVHTVYFIAVALAWRIGILIPMQALSAFVVAVTSCLGMVYIQDLMPATPAAATALFFNAARVGSIMSGILSGVMVGTFGYQGTFLGCGVLAFIALWLFLNPSWFKDVLRAWRRDGWQGIAGQCEAWWGRIRHALRGLAHRRRR